MRESEKKISSHEPDDPRAHLGCAYVWEMPADLVAELDKASPRSRPELDKLMDD